MTKVELIAAVANEANLTKKDAGVRAFVRIQKSRFRKRAYLRFNTGKRY